MTTSKIIKARALVDLDDGKIVAGEFFTADKKIIDSFVESGEACVKSKEKDVYGNSDVPPAKKLSVSNEDNSIEDDETDE